MTLSEFDKLDQKQQLELAWEKGVLEDTIAFGEHYYLLYKLSDFFIEIAFQAKTDEIIRVRSFN